MHIVRRAAAITGAAALTLTLSAASAGASIHPSPVPQTPVGQTVTATTSVTDHPDSGDQSSSNWANDNFTRVATVKRLPGTVPLADCPGSGTGFCYPWTGTLTDSGHFTTIAGALAPRAGTEDQSLTGTFNGGSKTIQFYSSWKTANASLVAKHVDGDVSGRETSTDWVEQFFGGTATFGSAASPGDVDLGKWSWTYELNFGSDSACPNDAYRWVDSAANGGGGQAADGNILTPSAADCT